MQHYRLLAPTEEVHRFANIVREVLNVAQQSSVIGAVLMCAVCRAPIAEVSAIDFSIFLSGQSGSFKSSIAALMLGFFGKFTDRTFPSNWSDTDADIQIKSHQAKDVVFVIDEFCAAGSQYDASKLHLKADNVLRSVGNQSGRGRRNTDMSGKTAYHPRGHGHCHGRR